MARSTRRSRGWFCQGLAHLVERPAQVDGRGPGADQPGDGGLEPGIGGIVAHGQGDAIGRRGADQRCSSHLHRLDRDGGTFEIDEIDHPQLVRQHASGR
jgi:hypothetical protein